MRTSSAEHEPAAATRAPAPSPTHALRCRQHASRNARKAGRHAPALARMQERHGLAFIPLVRLARSRGVRLGPAIARRTGRRIADTVVPVQRSPGFHDRSGLEVVEANEHVDQPGVGDAHRVADRLELAVEGHAFATCAARGRLIFLKPRRLSAKLVTLSNILPSPLEAVKLLGVRGESARRRNPGIVLIRSRVPQVDDTDTSERASRPPPPLRSRRTRQRVPEGALPW
jgi:hypothetical protein